MESINKQFDFTIDGCTGSLTINNGLINSSGTSLDILHCHPLYEIHCILYGENKVRYPNGVISADTGDIFIIPPGQFHCFSPIDNIGDHKRAAFWFDVNIVDVERKDKFVFERIHSIKNVTQIKDSFDAMRTVEEIQRELMEKKSCYEENLIHIFARLIIQICRSLESEGLQDIQANRTHQSLILLIEGYIQQHYKEDCTIENLSDYMHISRRHLTRLIRSLFSKSFRRILLEVRMSVANWLIEDKNISFETVASEVGYASLPAFYHAYGEFYSLTPGEYRKQCKDSDKKGKGDKGNKGNIERDVFPIPAKDMKGIQ